MIDSKTWMCLICGWIYDEATGVPDDGILPGTPWSQVPMNWTCPECGARKEDFEMVENLKRATVPVVPAHTGVAWQH